MSHHRLLRGLQWHMQRCTYSPWCHHTSKHTKCWQATYKSSNRITIRIMRHLKRHWKKKQPEIKSKEKYNAECKPQLQISAASKHCVGKCCLKIKHAFKKKKKKVLHTPKFSCFKGEICCNKEGPAISKGRVNHPFMLLYLQSSSQAPVSSVQKMQRSSVSGSLSGHSWDV